MKEDRPLTQNMLILFVSFCQDVLTSLIFVEFFCFMKLYVDTADIVLLLFL